MRYSERLDPEIDNLTNSESYASSCDRCGKWRIVDFEKDALSVDKIEGVILTKFKCLCGEVFHIQD